MPFKRTSMLTRFWVSLLAYLVGVFPAHLYALPSGGSVQGGSATITNSSGQTLHIEQSSQRAIIDWITYNIQNGEQVHYQMPGSDSVNLSRVTGGSPTEILGRLTSNGRIMLVNPNGILFGAGSQVDVSGLVATTSDISNEDFMAGNYNFQFASPFASTVINRGDITVSEGGLVAFVAPGVENSGTITARLGRVSLASGNTFTLDLYGDQLVSLGVNSKVTDTVVGPDGQAVSALVKNSGSIFADGGIVTLEVNAAKDLVDHAINMSGVVKAQSVVEENGAIYLLGGEDSNVHVSGTLDASGYGAGETGGTVHVLGDTVGLYDNALIDVSGELGGGTVLFGGDFQGNGTVQNATDTWVGQDASVYADAIGLGDGGRVIFWADRRNYFMGRIRAKGGSVAGNGGFVEVSGKEELFFAGDVDTTAVNGQTGTLLLDPENINITDQTGDVNDGELPSAFASGSVSFKISSLALESLSATTNVELFANDNITLEDLGDNVLDLKQTSGNFVKFTADKGNIIFDDVNDEIRTAGGDLTLTAGGSMTLGKLNVGTGTVTLMGGDKETIGVGAAPTGDLQITNTELAGITANNLVIGGDANSGRRAKTVTIDAMTVNNVSQTVSINALKPEEFPGFGPRIAGGNIAVNGNASTVAGNLVLNANEGISLADNATLTATNGGMTLNADLESNATNANIVGAGASSLVANNGTITLNDNYVSGGALSISGNKLVVKTGKNLSTSAGNLDVTGTNGITTGSTTFAGNGTTSITGDISATGDFTGTANEGLTLNGALTATGDVVLDGDANNANDAGADTLVLAAGRNIQSSGGSITVDATTGGISTSGAGTYFMSAANGLTINDNFSNNGATTLNSDNDSNGVGNLTVASGATINTSGNTLAITANDVFLAGNINSGASATTITVSDTGGVGLENADRGLDLSNTELGRITSTGLTVNGGTVGSTVDGVTSASLTNAGTLTLNGNNTVFSGTHSSFNGLTVGGAVLIEGVNISTPGAQNIDLNSSLGLTTGAAQISTGGGNIDIDGTVNGTQGLTINSGGGTVTFGSNVGATTVLDSLTVTGNTTFNGSQIRTNNGITLNSNFTASNALTLNADAATPGSGTLTIGGALATGGNALTITADDVALTGTIDSGAGVTSITVSDNDTVGIGDGAGNFNLNKTELAKITTAGGLTVTTGGAMVVDNVDRTTDLANITGPLSLNASGVTFSGSASSFNGLTVNVPVTIAGVNLSTNGQALNFNGTVDLTTAAVGINTSGGNITFGSTVNGGEDLTLTAGAGDVSVTGAVGGTTRLGALTVASAGNATFSSSVTAASVTQSAGTGTTTFGALDTNAAGGVNVTGNAFTFNNTVNTTSGGGVTIANGGQLTLASAADMTLTGAFSQTGAGAVSTAGDITTSNDNISFNSATFLTGEVSLNSGTGAGDITFSNTVDGTQALSLTSGTGMVHLDGNVGVGTALSSVNISGASTLSGVSVTTNGGAATFGGNVTLDNVASSISTGSGPGNITFTGTVDGSEDLTLTAGTGLISATGAVGGGTRLGALTIASALHSTFNSAVTAGSITQTAGTGTTAFGGAVDTDMAGGVNLTGSFFTLGGDVTSNNENITINGATTLSNTVSINSGAGAGNISLNAVNGAQALTLNSGTGTVTLNDNVGATTALDSLIVTGTTTMNGSQISANNGITLNSNFTASNALTLNADAATPGSGTLTIGGALATGGNALTITADDVALTGTIDSGAGVTSITVSDNDTVGIGDGAGNFNLNKTELAKITTAGGLTVTTGGAMVVDNVDRTTDLANITGPLSLNASGVTFSGSASSFNGLTVNVPVTIAGVNLSTNGQALNFNGTVDLTTAAVGINTSGGNITFGSTINGGEDLTLNSGAGTVTLGNNVGATTALDSLTVTGATTMNGSQVVANNGITLVSGFTGTNSSGLTLNADAATPGSGTLTVGDALSTSGNALSINADDIALTGTINSGTSATTVTVSDNGTVGMGDAAGDMTISGAQLMNITAGQLNIGSTTTGAITVDNVSAAQSTNINSVSLTSGGPATFNNGNTFKGLSVSADDVVVNAAVSAGTGDLSFNVSDGGTIGFGDTAGDLSLDNTELALLTGGSLTVGGATAGNLTVDNVTIDASKITGSLSLSSGGGITVQNALVSPVALTMTSAGAGQGITLNNSGHVFGSTVSLNTATGGNVLLSNGSNGGQTLNLGASNVGGSFSVNTGAALRLQGSVSANGNTSLTSSGGGIVMDNGTSVNAGAGTVALSANGNINLSQVISGSSSASAITLNSTGAVLDAGDSGGEDVIAANGGLVARTATGFGSDSDAIETRVKSVDIENSNSGPVNIFETDDIEVTQITQGGPGDVRVSFSGRLIGEDRITVLQGELDLFDRLRGLSLSKEVGTTGKKRDELAVERTVNNVNEIEKHTGSSQFRPLQENHTPAGTISRAGKGGYPYEMDVFSKDFRLVDVKGGDDPRHQQLKKEENMWRGDESRAVVFPELEDEKEKSEKQGEKQKENPPAKKSSSEAEKKTREDAAFLFEPFDPKSGS